MLRVGGINFTEISDSKKLSEKFESLSTSEREHFLLNKRYKVSAKHSYAISPEARFSFCEKKEGSYFKHKDYKNEFTNNSFRAFQFYLAYMHPGVIISDYENGVLDFEVVSEPLLEKLNKLLKI